MRRSAPALLIAVLLLALVAACSSGPAKKKDPSSGPASKAGTSAAPSPTSTGKTADPNAKTVNVTALQSDGATFGIGMPIVLYFNPVPTDISEFNRVVKVTLNGQPAKGAWYWEKPYADQPVQAHYRLQNYWPAHSEVKVEMPISGLYAGKGLKFSGKLTSIDFKIGDAHITNVSNNGPTGTQGATLTVTSNGQMVKTFKASLGAGKTPTYNGIKLVMQKGENTNGPGSPLKPQGTVQMTGPGYSEPVKWSVRVTASGEYVHAAPWNTHLGQLNTSNGCTNLSVADAEWFYNFSQVGDVVTYTGSTGSRVPSWDGFGDWNVSWGLWTQGGPDQPQS